MNVRLVQITCQAEAAQRSRNQLMILGSRVQFQLILENECDSLAPTRSAEMTLKITMLCCYAECHNAECWISYVIMLKVITLSVIMLNVVMLNVLAPSWHIHFQAWALNEPWNLGSWVDSSTIALPQLGIFLFKCHINVWLEQKNMPSCSSAEVKQWTHDPNFKGSVPADAGTQWKKKLVWKISFINFFKYKTWKKSINETYNASIRFRIAVYLSTLSTLSEPNFLLSKTA